MRLSAALPLAFALTLAFGCKKKGTEVTPPPVDETPAPVEVEPVEDETPEHVTAMKANFSRVFFEFDSSDLVDESKAALSDNVEIMQQHPDVKLQIQGHADERGTTDYNLALGQRRGDAIKEHLIAQGIGPSRLTVVSYGEEMPLVAGSTEQAWSKNRRAEFVITWGDTPALESSTEQPTP